MSSRMNLYFDELSHRLSSSMPCRRRRIIVVDELYSCRWVVDVDELSFEELLRWWIVVSMNCHTSMNYRFDELSWNQCFYLLQNLLPNFCSVYILSLLQLILQLNTIDHWIFYVFFYAIHNRPDFYLCINYAYLPCSRTRDTFKIENQNQSTDSSITIKYLRSYYNHAAYHFRLSSSTIHIQTACIVHITTCIECHNRWLINFFNKKQFNHLWGNYMLSNSKPYTQIKM